MAEGPAPLAAEADAVVARLRAAHEAREVALPACREVVRTSGSSIRAVHPGEAIRAALLADDAERTLRRAQDAVAAFPAVAHAGFPHDAEKESVEARAIAALVARAPVPDPDALGGPDGPAEGPGRVGVRAAPPRARPGSRG